MMEWLSAQPWLLSRRQWATSSKPMRHGYWGPSFDDDANRKGAAHLQDSHTKLSDPAESRGAILSQGKILVGFQGRMEFGRARLAAAPSLRSA